MSAIICTCRGFDRDEWTFTMPDDARAGAGDYAILPADEYRALVAERNECRSVAIASRDSVDAAARACACMLGALRNRQLPHDHMEADVDRLEALLERIDAIIAKAEGEGREEGKSE